MIGFLEREEVRYPCAGRSDLACGLLKLRCMLLVLALAGFQRNQLTQTGKGAADFATFRETRLPDSKLTPPLECAPIRNLIEKPVCYWQHLAHHSASRSVFQHLKKTFFGARIVETLNDAA